MKNKLILLLIILVASFLRFYQLGAIPVAVDWDEAALGYNAYSIMETGRDEYGEFLPLVLRSFDDYKPALYSYLAIPSIKIFGLNNFAVRFSSAFFGVLTVLASYFLVQEIFRKPDEKGGNINNSSHIALLASFLLAISPWHIQFSRAAFEANIGLSLNVFTALLFLKSFRKPLFLPFSAFFAGLTLYSYQSEKVFAPLFALTLVLIYGKDLLKLPRKYLLSAFVIGIITISPMLIHLASNTEALSRAKGSLVTSTQTELLEKNIERIEIDRERNDFLGLVFDNRRVSYFKSAIAGYLSHFDPNWLFVTGDSARHHAPGMGLLYLWELPFLFIGIYVALFHKFFARDNRRGRLFLFSWFLVAPIPAAFTTDVPHAVRTLNFLPTFQIFVAAGLLVVVSKVLKISAKGRSAFGGKYKILRVRVSYLLLTAYCLFIVFNVSHYINQYFVQLNYFHSKYWQYGRKEEIEFVKGVQSEYEKIVVSDKDFLDQSYIFYLYYLNYSPAKYQNESKIFSNGKENVRTFGKYEFRTFEWDEEEAGGDVLYVGGPHEFGEGADALRRINYLNGEEAAIIAEKRL
jgi:4-amino-4-deoxy-L-arabinose transferase-like glycosyltransferase